MKTTRCVHMTSAHDATDNRIWLCECKTLAEAGYDVVLIAPGEEDSVLDGIPVRAIRKHGGRLKRMVLTVWHVYRAALREKADIYHFHDPELIGVGLLLKLQGKRVIYDVHEDLPRQTLSKDYLPPFCRRFVAVVAEIVETAGAFVFDAIVAATPTIARRFPQRKTVSVQNFPYQEEFFECAESAPADRPSVIAYAGILTRIRGVKEMISSMAFLPESLDARLVLAGTCSPANLESELRTLAGYERSEFVGQRSRKEVSELMASARVGLVLYYPERNHVASEPAKLFEYMSAGLPVVASNFPYWRKFVERTKCGLSVDPLDPRAIAEAIQWLLEHPDEAAAMGRNGQEAVRTTYNWRTQGKILTDLYARFAKPSQSGCEGS